MPPCPRFFAGYNSNSQIQQRISDNIKTHIHVNIFTHVIQLCSRIIRGMLNGELCLL